MNVRSNLLFVLLGLLFSFGPANGQETAADWYSESATNGIIIQNSYNKGGPYLGPTENNYNHSYLVYYSRVTNGTKKPIELTLTFPADSFAIPGSPHTFVKLFLPPDTMTLDKNHKFSYGVTELKSLEQPTHFKRRVLPNQDCLFYVVAIYYQTKADARNEGRGGNRAELVLKGADLFYNQLPQVDAMPCGRIIFE